MEYMLMIIKPGDKLTANFQESIHIILKEGYEFLMTITFIISKSAIYRRTSSWYSRLE